MKPLIDHYGNELTEGARVYCFDFDAKKVYGTLYLNKDYQHVSRWFIAFDDGNDCAVLNEQSVFKA